MNRRLRSTKNIHPSSGSIFDGYLIAPSETVPIEVQQLTAHWSPTQVEQLVFGFLMKTSLAGLYLLVLTEDRTQAFIWSFTCRAVESKQSLCLCAAGWGRCKAASAWCLSWLFCPGRYWCSYCFPETHGRSSVLGSRSRGKSFTTDLERKACSLCHVLGFQSLFHLPGMEDKQLSCSSFSLVVEANVLPSVVLNLTACNEGTCSRRLKSKLQLLQWSFIIS